MTNPNKERDILCTLVQDLLPLHIEELTSAEAEKILEEHLADCPVCREKEDLLRRNMLSDTLDTAQSEKQEINYLKKIRNRSRRNLLAGILIAVLLIAGGAVLKLFVIGYETENFHYTGMELSAAEDRPDNAVLTLAGKMDGKTLFREYEIREKSGGSKELIIYGRLPLPWEKPEPSDENRSFDGIEISTADFTEEFTFGDNVFRQDGTLITEQDFRLYDAKNPYVGDMPANAAIAQILGIADNIGSFTSELDTEGETLGWTLQFTSPVSSAEASAQLRQQMTAYACSILSLIDNLDEVRWTWQEETADGPVSREGSLNIDEAGEIAGTNIKDMADSPESVSRLRQILYGPGWQISAKPDFTAAADH
ncbi:MAG: DUF4825 domain-containing protein [Emergencia sp.]